MKLGEGGFSVVVGAHLDGTPVALKVAKGGGKEQAPIKALRQEWLIMKSASFHHEHLATYIGTCLVAGCPALVLEHYEGGNLSDALGYAGRAARVANWSVHRALATHAAARLWAVTLHSRASYTVTSRPPMCSYGRVRAMRLGTRCYPTLGSRPMRALRVPPTIMGPGVTLPPR